MSNEFETQKQIWQEKYNSLKKLREQFLTTSSKEVEPIALPEDGGDEKYIEPLQPGLLGDYLIRKVLIKHGEEFFERVLV